MRAEPTEALLVETLTQLDHATAVELRTLLDTAFPNDFSDDDWNHCLGGTHFIIRREKHIVAHASVVTRSLWVSSDPNTPTASRHPLNTGFVEAVAVRPDLQGKRLGHAVMLEVNKHIYSNYSFGALSSDKPAFYGKLGWVFWKGESFVASPAGQHRIADSDDCIMVLTTARAFSPDMLTQPITCDWRAGDVW